MLKIISTLLVALMVSACATQVNDRGCAWSKQIDAVATNDDVFLVIVQNQHVLRPLTDQINNHNTARHKVCN